MPVIVSNEESISKRVLYAQAVFGDEEKKAVLESMENGWLAAGPKVAEFEAEVAKRFGKKYALAVNSGSSANLLGVAALDLPVGSYVITPACTFSTTVSALLLNGLIPVFVDVGEGTYVIDPDKLEGAYTGNVSAIMVPQLVGAVSDMERIQKFAQEHNLKLIDDSCDTFAPHLNDRPVATYADISTTSFYGSHVITAMGVGGMVMTDDEELYKKMLTLRDWGRVGNDKEAFENRFNCEIDGIPYDSKFFYTEIGYNLKMNEGSAAFGLEQLKKLPEFEQRRTRNFNSIYHFFREYEKWFVLPVLNDQAKTAYLAFPLTIRQGAPFTRYEFLQFLESKGVQTRVLFSGNIIRHPLYKRTDVKWIVSGALHNADAIMARGFLLGCHQGMGAEECTYLFQACKEFLTKYEN